MTSQSRHRVVHVAASKAGTPYRYGASGPGAFDCSGFTKWVFSRLGRHLPRTSSAQAGAVRHVSRSQRHKGDLVFFRSGGHVYHVGIYAGHNQRLARSASGPAGAPRAHLDQLGVLRPGALTRRHEPARRISQSREACVPSVARRSGRSR